MADRTAQILHPASSTRQRNAPRLLAPLIESLCRAYVSLVHRATSRRNILVNITSENSFAIFAPVYEALRKHPAIHIFFTSTLAHKYHKNWRRRTPWRHRLKAPLDIRQPALDLLKPYAIDPARILSPRQVRFRRWDACIDSVYKSPRIFFPTTRIQIFHGFSGKFTPTGKNYTLNHAASRYDKLFCLSSLHAEMFRTSGLLKNPSAAECIGFPKLDALLDDRITRDEVLREYGADPSKTSVLYAPSWNPQLSLNTIGEQLIELLSSKPWTLLVKLHPISNNSFDKPRGYTRTDWPQFLDEKKRANQLIHVTDQTTARYLKAADILITDHGSTLYEYMPLNRPILYYDTPDAASVMTMPQTLPDIRQATHPFQRPQQALQILTSPDLADTPQMTRAKEQFIQDRFYDIPNATQRAANAIRQLLDLKPPPG